MNYDWNQIKWIPKYYVNQLEWINQIHILKNPTENVSQLKLYELNTLD